MIPRRQKAISDRSFIEWSMMGCACVKLASAAATPSDEHARDKHSSSTHSDASRRVDLPEKHTASATQEQPEASQTRFADKEDKLSSRVERPSGRIPRQAEGEQVAAGWPDWLSAAAGESINGWIPRKANTFQRIEKIGEGTYSNVYKARDLVSEKIVALKKVRLDNVDPDSVNFMAREIRILRRLDHPNVIKLEGLAISRLSYSLYLVFEYMENDLAGLAASPEIKFTEPQVKCFLHQLLSGLEHCHNRHVLHRDIKSSNLLLGNSGILKIADFGLAQIFNPETKQSMTNKVVTLWYRPPELLLGATEYGVAVDIWSTGCILAELLKRKPILPGRTEVEQLHRIFKLCGSPSEDYWKSLNVSHATIFKFQRPYKRTLEETFKDFGGPVLLLLAKLLAIEPLERGTATVALASEFFTSEPHACEPSSLPQYTSSKMMDIILREEGSRRQTHGFAHSRRAADTSKRVVQRGRATRAIPAPEANAESQANILRQRIATQVQAKSKSEKFPPAHEDCMVGLQQGPLLGHSGMLMRPSHSSTMQISSKSGPMVSATIDTRGKVRRKNLIHHENGFTHQPAHSAQMNITSLSQSGDFLAMDSIKNNLSQQMSSHNSSSNLKPPGDC